MQDGDESFNRLFPPVIPCVTRCTCSIPSGQWRQEGVLQPPSRQVQHRGEAHTHNKSADYIPQTIQINAV